jgi:murein tripeptide amidase MpaA
VTYLNVTEVESALQGLAQTYPALCELVALPNPSVEGRACHALRIGTTPLADGVLFTGCQHAREWGGAEICVYFAADLLEAYTAQSGLAYGAKHFNAAEVRWVVENVNVVVFPCVNPDGRAYDQQRPDRLWRKNRSPAAAGGDPARVGVDVNRNHPFLWDFPTKFSTQAVLGIGTVASDSPGDPLYHGPAPASEPEARNIHWLLDRYRFTRWHLDIHSFAGTVMFPWGDDENQSYDSQFNFRNPTWDGRRGDDGIYGEFIRSDDHAMLKGAALHVAQAINAVRGGHYETIQSVSLPVPERPSLGKVNYPVSGDVSDYAFSRHMIDCTKSKVYAIALEFGYWTGDYRSSFSPPWAEMEHIIREIDAGMMALCLGAPQIVPPAKILIRRLWPWEIWDPMVRALGRLARVVGRRVQAVRG